MVCLQCGSMWYVVVYNQLLCQRYQHTERSSALHVHHLLMTKEQKQLCIIFYTLYYSIIKHNLFQSWNTTFFSKKYWISWSVLCTSISKLTISHERPPHRFFVNRHGNVRVKCKLGIEVSCAAFRHPNYVEIGEAPQSPRLHVTLTIISNIIK